jgi:flagellar hook-associated protein 1 FlgK
MSLQAALDIASSGLANINVGLAVLSQNIANASTPQYATEIAGQQALQAGGQPNGVQTLPTLVATDAAIQAQLNAAVSADSGAQTTSAALANIEPVLGTVGSGNDLGSLLTNVQSAFSALLNDPSSNVQQNAVVQSAVTLANGINALAQAYGTASQNAQNNLVSEVGQLNAALGTIGSLTSQIVSLKAQGQSTADLQNQLARAESTVTSLIDARFVPQENGDVIVLTANGSQLPTHTANPLSISSATTGPGTYYPDGGLPGIKLGNLDITSQLGGGSIAANITLRDSTIPTYQAALDEFSENLSTRFSAQGLTLFSNPDGTIPQSSGAPTQSGYVGYSNTITVNPAVIATPSLVRDGTETPSLNSTGLSGYTDLINNVLNYTFGSDSADGVAQPSFATTGLGASGTLSSGYAPQATLLGYANTLTASQAADSNTATTTATDTAATKASLQGTVTGAIGVDMDTQLGYMITLQDAYGANAKVISTLQTLFQDALDMVVTG